MNTKIFQQTTCHCCGRTLYVRTRETIPIALRCSICTGTTPGLINEHDTEYLPSSAYTNQIQEYVRKLGNETSWTDAEREKIYNSDVLFDAYAENLFDKVLSGFDYVEQQCTEVMEMLDSIRHDNDVWSEV